MSSILVHISGQREIVTKKDNLVFISHAPTSPPAQSGGSLSPAQEQDLADSKVHILLVTGENPHNTTHAALPDRGTLTHAQLETSLVGKESAGTAQGLVTTHEATHPAPAVRDSRSQVAGSYEQAGEAAAAVTAHEAKTNDSLHPQYKIAGSAPATHASSHTGADSIRDATPLVKGLATIQHITTLDANTDKLSGIENGATADQAGAEIKSLYEGEANTNAFTDAEKSKVAALESSKFLGTYVDLSALIAAHPSPVEGSYAHVDSGVGVEVSVYIWDIDDATYFEQLGEVSGETAASIKTKYESNPDTNAFTDIEKSNLSSHISKAQHDFEVRTITTPTDTATESDYYISLDTSSNNVVLTLPEEQGAFWQLKVRHDFSSAGDNEATITNTVDGEAGPHAIPKGYFFSIIFDGTKWTQEF